MLNIVGAQNSDEVENKISGFIMKDID
jgi:hypothetical protein